MACHEKFRYSQKSISLTYENYKKWIISCYDQVITTDLHIFVYTYCERLFITKKYISYNNKDEFFLP